ncbi:MAG: hypothetical protein RLZZ156_1446 [Deinococcota bacterium]|jgi:hypothetical protein
MKKLLQNTLLFGLIALAACQPPADTTPPTVTLSLSNATPKVGAELALRAEATDNVGIKQVEFFAGETSLSLDSEAPYQTTAQVNANVTTYKAVATDIAGNTSESVSTITIAKDTTPPEVSLSISPSVLIAGTPATLTAVATDNTAVTQVEFFANAISLGTDTTQPFEQALTAAQIIAGETLFRAVATDTGNNTTAANLTVTIAPAPAPTQNLNYTVRLKDIEVLAKSTDEDPNEGLQLDGVLSTQLQDVGSAILASHEFINISQVAAPLSLRSPFVAREEIFEGGANSPTNKILITMNLFERDGVGITSQRNSFGQQEINVNAQALKQAVVSNPFVSETIIETSEGDKIKVVFEIFKSL